jgi:hypothetical protein
MSCSRVAFKLWRRRASAVEKSLGAVENRRSAVEKWPATVENAVEIPRKSDAELWMTCG